MDYPTREGKPLGKTDLDRNTMRGLIALDNGSWPKHCVTLS